MNYYYVKNISNGRVVFSELNISIGKGAIINLLKLLTEDQIKNSKDIQIALDANWIKFLTNTELLKTYL